MTGEKLLLEAERVLDLVCGCSKGSCQPCMLRAQITYYLDRAFPLRHVTCDVHMVTP